MYILLLLNILIQLTNSFYIVFLVIVLFIFNLQLMKIVINCIHAMSICLFQRKTCNSLPDFVKSECVMVFATVISRLTNFATLIDLKYFISKKILKPLENSYIATKLVTLNFLCTMYTFPTVYNI